MFTERLARRPERGQLVLATGAPAGSANALISLINSCSPPIERVHESLNWQVWVPPSFDAFFDADAASPQNILTRAPMAAAMEHIWQRWRAGLRADCDVVLAVSVTRLEPTMLALHPELKVPHQETKFVLRIRGRGPGRAPLIENYPDRASHLAQPLLHLLDPARDDDADRVNFEHLRNLVFASSAFPLAFSPQTLRYCLAQPSPGGDDNQASGECREPTHEARFIDGGVFDNTPLRLAYRTASRGLIRDDAGGLRWDPQGQRDANATATPSFVYLNPYTHAYPALQTNAQVETRETIDYLEAMGKRLCRHGSQP